MMRTSVACLLAVFLSACESLSPAVSESIPVEISPATHTARLNKLLSWKLEGRISIRLEDDAWHAGLYWQQFQDIYHIRIIAPFGQGGAQLDGNENGVIMHSSEGKFRALSADQLLAEQFGRQIPVDGLRYWVLGRPAPAPDDQEGEQLPPLASYDRAGRISELSQGGWQVEYRSYKDVNGLSLPEKIFLKHANGLDVRVVVDSWSMQPAPVAGDEQG